MKPKRRLKDFQVDEVSIVDKAANLRDFLLLKSMNHNEDEGEEQIATYQNREPAFASDDPDVEDLCQEDQAAINKTLTLLEAKAELEPIRQGFARLKKECPNIYEQFENDMLDLDDFTLTRDDEGWLIALEE